MDIIDGSGFWVIGNSAAPPTPVGPTGPGGGGSAYGLLGFPDDERKLTDAELAVLMVILADD